MSILDKAKVAAEHARGQAAHGVAQGRARLMEVQARRQHGKLARQLGEACYAEHSGEGSHEAVAAAFAALDAHAQAHPQTRAPGRLEAVRQARDIMHPGAECIGEGDSVAAAAQKMRDLGVGSLPICGADDRLHGILTGRDIVLRCVAEGATRPRSGPVTSPRTRCPGSRRPLAWARCCTRWKTTGSSTCR